LSDFQTDAEAQNPVLQGRVLMASSTPAESKSEILEGCAWN
jgi:hypothetical protein